MKNQHVPGLEIPRDRMLTAREVGSILRLTEKRVRQLALRGEIPSHRQGGKVLFAPGDVEALIRDARRV